MLAHDTSLRIRIKINSRFESADDIEQYSQEVCLAINLLTRLYNLGTGFLVILYPQPFSLILDVKRNSFQLFLIR